MYSVILDIPSAGLAPADRPHVLSPDLAPVYTTYREYVKALETLEDPSGCSVTLYNGNTIIQQRIYQSKEAA